MSLQNGIKRLVERFTDLHVYEVLPRGCDCVNDIGKLLPRCPIKVVFDVGANVGQSAKTYLARYPNSRVYCFEPVSETFQRLQANLKGNQRVECYQLAVGSSNGQGRMVKQGQPDMFFLLEPSKRSPKNGNVPIESVAVVTLDEFCRRRKIDHISYLKVDTEGGDLEVLKGAADMLAEHRVDLVDVEAGMNPNNSWHVPLELLKKFLESHRYFLFGIYEQVNEWLIRQPHLRRTNSLFVSYRMIEVNTQPPAVLRIPELGRGRDGAETLHGNGDGGSTASAMFTR